MGYVDPEWTGHEPEVGEGPAPAANVVATLGAAGLGLSRFRLVRPGDRVTMAATGRPPPGHFIATILLDRHWEPDIAAIAATARLRFPRIGRIDLVPRRGGGALEGIGIDGATVTLSYSAEPVPEVALAPPLKLVRPWNPSRAIRRHVGRLDISCGGELPGLEGAEAYAAAVHFIAAAATAVAPATAVFWRTSWTISEPRAFADAADAILSGRMPVGAWVGFATIVLKGYDPAEATGVATYGLRRFIGREVELAPRPTDARDACHAASRVARLALERGLELREGLHIADPEGAFAATVRERPFWMRRDLPAYVLVAADAVVDARTLKPRGRSAA